MSAAPSWPLVIVAPRGQALPKCGCGRPSGLFRSISRAGRSHSGPRVLNLFFLPSKRKTTRGARPSSLPPVRTISSRTAKARNCLFSQRPAREPPPLRAPAALSCSHPIWDDNRGESRGKPQNPHTFSCSTRLKAPLLHVFCRWPDSSSHLHPLPDPRAWTPGLAALARDRAQATCRYLSSTFAPAFSSWALILSASSLFTPSLTLFGAPSTRSLASFRPRPVMARTSLMTSIFFSPAAASTTVNSVFSSAGAAAPPPPAAGPATATAAAAETPHFSSRSFASSAASSTVRLERSSTIFCKSAIDQFP